MRASSLGPWSVIALISAAVAAGGAACSAAANGTGSSAGTGGASSGGASSESSGALGNGGGASSSTASGLSGTTTSTSSGGAAVASAYAHTDTTLFKLDPSKTPLVVTQIGDFDCIGSGTGQDDSMTDLAVTEAGAVWGVSQHNVYQLTLPASGTGAVHCATTVPLKSASGVSFYGLTFAPAGVLGAGEVLVAANTAGQLFSIDASGNLVQHGTFGNVPANDGQGHTYPAADVGLAWELSGDIVFLANNGNPVGFATVRDCPTPPYSTGCNKTDTLVEINMTTFATAGTQSVTLAVRGQVVKAPSCNDPNNTTYGSMYGIAAYQGNVFGFSHQGSIVTIDNTNGSACLALSTPNDEWAGAAITTVAPVIVTN
jgi:hypothetical protein